MLSDKKYVVMVKHLFQDKEMSDIEKRVTMLEQVSADAKVAEMNVKQYARRANVEIHGVRILDGENLLEKMNNVVGNLQVQPPKLDDVEAVSMLLSKTEIVP